MHCLDYSVRTLDAEDEAPKDHNVYLDRTTALNEKASSAAIAAEFVFEYVAHAKVSFIPVHLVEEHVNIFLHRENITG